MSTTATKTETVGGITIAWINEVAACLTREGNAFRAGRDALTIEVQVINTGTWMPLTLEGRQAGPASAIFANVGLRDVVLAALQQRVYAVRLVAEADPTADRGQPGCAICNGRGYVAGPSGSHDCDCVR